MSEEDVALRLAHERLSKAAAEGGFTLGGIDHWSASDANCAAAMAERANHLRERATRGGWESVENLTKRELFAAMALQGRLSSGGWENVGAVAKDSVVFADLLLKELAR
jgi:uncharacterized alpha-E superfamily protein